ncbi:hypothetical protein F2Q69_00026603 [Brassica cretica]|uniref:Transposase MuDR plant domain-containing protein n=1 Tax=Brassica cretica TaxID=69181 RepID=A0A8S9RX51_BRACR|nr:hypothetical protein F2Q69_00026603 [Brassica cretica]
MAFYAIRKKFRFKNSRSAPDGMVLRCYSRTCKWRVYAVLLKNTELYENSGVYGVHVISGTEYQVIDKEAANRNKVSITSLVSECYSIPSLKAAYAKNIFPAVEKNDLDDLPSQLSGLNLNVNPPASRRPPGRPRKTRILSRGEVKMKVARKPNFCSRCKGSGHNKATCKMAI